eukprot:PhF_6_TR42155/c0_g1_i1/m.63707
MKPLYRRHPLEFDGVVPLYSTLTKKNKSLLTCPLVRVPDTVVYDHGIPTGWYYSMKKPNNGNEYLSRRSARSLDVEYMNQYFSKERGDIRGQPVEAVAMFIYVDLVDDVPTIFTKFLDSAGVNNLLLKTGQKPDGILQKFLPPANETNCVIMAIWSPKICLVRSRRTLTSIIEKTEPLFTRCVTFEGLPHFSEESNCALRTTELVKLHCNAIARHFEEVENVKLARIVLYFKMDDKNDLWLLWCASLRIEGEESQAINFDMPFHTPSEVCRSTKDVLKRSWQEKEANKMHEDHLNNPFDRASPPPPPLDDSSQLLMSLETAQANRERHEKKFLQNVANLKLEWYGVNDAIKKRYFELKTRQEFLLSVVSDFQYESYTHMQTNASQNFFYYLPTEVLVLLGEASTIQLLEILRVESDEPRRTLEVCIPREASVGEVMHNAERGKAFVLSELEKHILELKGDAWPFVEQKVVSLALALDM